MPNWVCNKVKMNNKGSEIIKNIITKRKGEDFFDFNKVVPMPKTMNLMAGGIENEAINCALLKMSDLERNEMKNKFLKKEHYYYQNYYEKLFLKDLNEKELNRIKEIESNFLNKYSDDEERKIYQDLGIETLEDLGKIYINNILEYGVDNWYDWSIKNWGTKWNSNETFILGDDEIEFQTAWDCPYQLLMALSKMYQDVEFDVSYADEDLGSNCGRFILKNGEQIVNYDLENPRKFALEIWGWEEDEFDE